MRISPEGKIGIALGLVLGLAAAVTTVVNETWVHTVGWITIAICLAGMIALLVHHFWGRWRRLLRFIIPVGVALTMVEDLPGLIAKGRQRFETDVRNARVIGEFVVTRGQREVSARVDKLRHSEPEAAAGASGDAGGGTAAGAAPAPAAAPSVAKPTPDPADGVIVDTALAGYDTLSASQVVRRLESLGPDELRAVHRHEASHRNRRTILNRAHQLLDALTASDATTGVPADAVATPDRSPE